MDDEPLILEMVPLMLHGQDFLILTAASPSEAIGMALEHAGHLDLLLTDVIMPGTNGFELAKRLRTLHPDLEVLFMSGSPARELPALGFSPNEKNFLAKPFSRTQLLSLIGSHLNRADQD